MSEMFAALVNLNHPGHYVHWGFVQISVANLVVIILMLVVFALALAVPFPRHPLSPPGSRPGEAPPSPAAEQRPQEGIEP